MPDIEKLKEKFMEDIRKEQKAAKENANN